MNDVDEGETAAVHAVLVVVSVVVALGVAVVLLELVGRTDEAHPARERARRFDHLRPHRTKQERHD